MMANPIDLTIAPEDRLARRMREIEENNGYAVRARKAGGVGSGAAGPPGANGATWYSGAGAPAAELGANNDFYLRTSNEDVYKKSGGTWSVITNIKGSTGATGGAGTNGIDGAAIWTPVVTTGVKNLGGGAFEKTSATESEGQVYSAQGYTQGAFVSFKAVTTNKGIGIGLDTAPESGSGFVEIDYFLNLTAGGTILLRENGAEVAGGGGAYAAGDVFTIIFDGAAVKYYQWVAATNETKLLREVARPVGKPLFADSWWNQSGGKVENMVFGPVAPGPTGATGASGSNGTGAPIACRLATAGALAANTRTGNVLEANAVGVQTIDGIAMAVNDQILVKNETTGANNGVYKVITVGTAGVKFKLERISSFDESAEAIPGMMVTVSEGSTNLDSVWQLLTNAPITLNTTALVFVPLAPSYTLEGIASESPALTEATKVIGGTEITLPYAGFYKIEAYFDVESAGGFGLLGAIEVAGVIKGPEAHSTAIGRESVAVGFKTEYLAAGTKVRLSAKRGGAATTVYSGHTRIVAQRVM